MKSCIKHGDPNRERTIKRMLGGGSMSISAVGRTLGVAHSTIYWYINKWKRNGETWGQATEATQPVERPVCMVCHGAAASWDGHPACRGRR